MSSSAGSKIMQTFLLDEMQVRQQVRSYILENFALSSGPEIDDTTSLVESGLLDSTSATELVAFLEHAFPIHIREDDVTAENLDSVERIGTMLTRLFTESEGRSVLY